MQPAAHVGHARPAHTGVQDVSVQLRVYLLLQGHIKQEGVNLLRYGVGLQVEHMAKFWAARCDHQVFSTVHGRPETPALLAKVPWEEVRTTS